MNQVSVQTVAAALIFFALSDRSHERETYIVSDDEAPTNNYRDVEDVLLQAFGQPDYRVPLLSLPLPAQRIARAAIGRPASVHRRFRCDKLLADGFVKPVAFETALSQYADYLARQVQSTKSILG